MALLKEKIQIGIEEAELKTQKVLWSISPVFRWLLIIMALSIVPAYFVAKAISQKIWATRYQQTELKASPSFTDPKNVKISEVSLTTLGENLYSAVVQIANENLDLSAQNVPFEFNFFNAEKQLLYSYSDKLFLLPDQKKYIIAPRFSANEQIAFTEFRFVADPVWQKRLNIPGVELQTSTPNNYNQISPPAFVVEGNFINNSVYTLKQVRLNFVLFDSFGKIIGSSRRDEFTVAPYERRSYKQLWPNVIAPTLGKTEIVAETNTLDPNNLAIPTAPSSSASDLSRPK